MKTNKLSIIAASAMLVLMASCAGEDNTQSDNDKGSKEKEDVGTTVFATNYMSDGIGTRTSMDYSSGNFFWEKSDRIYVKDDTGTFKTSSNSVADSKQVAFKFMMPGIYEASDKYMVYYPGEKGTNNNVTIKDNQQQDIPNDNTHFGTSGDCGMGYGEKSNGQFNFKLEHKAAYLCFLPSTSHDLVSTYITKIEVTSDNEIAGSYTLDLNSERLVGSGNYKTITLNLGNSDSYKDGFPLNNNAPSLTTNGAFMVIYPGTHKLTVKYHVKDIQTEVEGVITKKLKLFDYKMGEYYDIKSKLDVQSYDSYLYMWDAKYHAWYEYESSQPALRDDPGTNYPQSNTDKRWYNDQIITTGTGGAQAENSPTKDCPNVNEMLWYCIKGDPHWDSDKMWTTLKVSNQRPLHGKSTHRRRSRRLMTIVIRMGLIKFSSKTHGQRTILYIRELLPHTVKMPQCISTCLLLRTVRKMVLLEMKTINMAWAWKVSIGALPAIACKIHRLIRTMAHLISVSRKHV